MSIGYTYVQWSPHKRLYDAVVTGGVIAYVAVFFIVSKLLFTGTSGLSDEVLLIRATGSCAITLLHIIVCIGPLARLDRRFLPVLYNRRHLGVITFLIALVHGLVSTGYYHGFGVLNPLVSLLTSNTNYTSLTAFPFQIPGLLALLILFVLAATSHDFWLKNLTAATWKRLHMLVYLAYALLIAHVALGALQSEGSLLTSVLMFAGVAIVTSLHLLAGLREVRRDVSDAGPAGKPGHAGNVSPNDSHWIDVGSIDDIPEDRARTVCAPGGERIAVFKHAGSLSAISNVCAHQGGPLGEGKVIDGCVTCPWHGWQYRPQDGCSPPPFAEKVGTYQVRILAGRVQVDPALLPTLTPAVPVRIAESTHV